MPKPNLVTVADVPDTAPLKVDAPDCVIIKLLPAAREMAPAPVRPVVSMATLPVLVFEVLRLPFRVTAAP